MPAQRLSKEKRVYILAALTEGTPINAVCRMFKVGKCAVLRVIDETGEAFADYMDRNFRDLPCERIEMDEQWQYVGKHGQRMATKEKERGDFWLWAAIDPDTKLVFSHMIGRHNNITGTAFVDDVGKRVKGAVQIATDSNRGYACNIRGAFDDENISYGTETKVFNEQRSEMHKERKNGIPHIAKSTRKAVIGSPDLKTVTTSHIERVFLSVRQELSRFSRLTLAFSKDLGMHKRAVAMHFGIYNFVRKHLTIGTTPAVAAGLEEKPWGMVRVVEMTDAYFKAKEEAMFEAAFEEAGI